MLSSLRSWWGRRSPTAGYEAPRRWARQIDAEFKEVREAEGFVIEWRVDGLPARIEWGASTRPYLRGRELRLRAEVALPPDLQVLLIEQHLMAALESAVFAQATGAVQTRLDDATPEEMRWLVLLPALPLPAELQTHIGAVSNAAPWLDAWLDGELVRELARQPRERPFVLMINQARLTLRTAMQMPQVEEIARLHALFGQAIARMPAATLAWAAAETGNGAGQGGG